MEIGIFMKISETHQFFANWLNDQRALSHPEEFLGPNWKEVLNFWIYLDALSDEQLDIVDSQYCAYDLADKISMLNLAESVANTTTTERIAYVSAMAGWWNRGATWELMGAHKILEQGKPLTFVPLFLSL
jgi:hypothetical protein